MTVTDWRHQAGHRIRREPTDRPEPWSGSTFQGALGGIPINPQWRTAAQGGFFITIMIAMSLFGFRGLRLRPRRGDANTPFVLWLRPFQPPTIKLSRVAVSAGARTQTPPKI